MKKREREKGMVPLTRYLQEFKPGEKVAIKIEPSSKGGIPHRRFQGKVGEVIGKQGDAYVLRVKMGGKEKNPIVRPEHLKGVYRSR